MANGSSIKQLLTLLPLALLLTACAGQPTPLPVASQPVKPAAIPALPAASAAATRAAMVLADVLKRADQRAGDLAEVADQARARGVTCEQAYEALAK